MGSVDFLPIMSAFTFALPTIFVPKLRDVLRFEIKGDRNRETWQAQKLKSSKMGLDESTRYSRYSKRSPDKEAYSIENCTMELKLTSIQ